MVSLIVTVKNEEKTIQRFLDSVLNQTVKPNEVIIVDGGSADETLRKIEMYKKKIKNLKVLVKKGNRSIGRNTAIKNSKNEIIACTDAGCILEKNWLENIMSPFSMRTTEVVAGYYKGRAKTPFEECVIPYVLVMPDKINEQEFLPATRSIAFKKSVWKRVGKFNEGYSHNEDFVFAKVLKKKNVKIIFKKNAVVYWLPVANISSFYTMCRRFAYGDAESNIYRPKALLILARYLFGVLVLLYLLPFKHYFLVTPMIILILLYIFWAIFKNYKYVKKWQAFFYLPLLQFVSDAAVINGTILGSTKLIWDIKIK